MTSKAIIINGNKYLLLAFTDMILFPFNLNDAIHKIDNLMKNRAEGGLPITWSCGY